MLFILFYLNYNIKFLLVHYYRINEYIYGFIAIIKLLNSCTEVTSMQPWVTKLYTHSSLHVLYVFVNQCLSILPLHKAMLLLCVMGKWRKVKCAEMCCHFQMFIHT